MRRNVVLKKGWSFLRLVIYCFVFTVFIQTGYCFVFIVFIHDDSSGSQSQRVEWLVLGGKRLSVEVVWAGLAQVTLMLGRYVCHYHLVYISVVIWYSCDMQDTLSWFYYTYSFPWVLFWPNSIMGNGILSETFLHIARFSSNSIVIVSSCPSVCFTVYYIHIYFEILFTTAILR